ALGRVVRMQDLGPAGAQTLLVRQSGIVAPLSVDVIGLAVGPGGPDALEHDFRKEAVLLLAGRQRPEGGVARAKCFLDFGPRLLFLGEQPGALLFEALLIFDIRQRSEPFDDMPLAVAQGPAADQKPAIHAVTGPADAIVHFDG